MAKYNEEELSRIQEILAPLNVNPIVSESLSPMSKVLRRIKGEPEPEALGEENQNDNGSSDGGIEVKESPEIADEPPAFKNFDEDDDGSLDDLLDVDIDNLGKGTELTDDQDGGIDVEEMPPEADFETDPPDNEIPPIEEAKEPPPKVEPKLKPAADDDLFDGLTDDSIMDDEPEEESVTDEPILEDTETPAEEPETDNPFADLEAASDEDPFADVADLNTDDPFADTEETPAINEDITNDFPETDPFAEAIEPNEDLDSEETPQEIVDNESFEEDDFSLEGEDKTPNEETLDDPFNEMNDIPDITDSSLPAIDDFNEDSEPVENLDDLAGLDLEEETEEKPTEEFADDSAGFDGFDSEDDFQEKTEESEPVEDDPFASMETIEGASDSPEIGDDSDAFADFDSTPSIVATADEDEDDQLGKLDDVSHDDGITESFETDLDSLGSPDDDDSESKGFDLTDEELAIIQQEILHYPPKLKRHVIDAITKDKLSPKATKELVELIKSSQKPQDIAAYLSDQLGYPVELFDDSGKFSEQGIPIISTDPLYTKEGEFKRRQFLKRMFIGAAAAILLLTLSITGYKYVFKPLRAASYYNDGLESLHKAGAVADPDKRKQHLRDAESSFDLGERINPNDVKYLNKYGLAYMKIGNYDKAFEKLFGKVEPDFGEEKSDPNHNNAWNKRVEVPYITMAPGQRWDDEILAKSQSQAALQNTDPKSYLRMMAQDKTERRIIKAGAYIVTELGLNAHDNETYINLAKFHSNTAENFTSSLSGDLPNGSEPIKQYKNDQLAINYYKQVFTDGGEPHNIDATAGLAKIYYNQESYAKSASYYNKIIEIYPKNPIGHGGLLSTYIELWRKDKNPQFVLNHHRQIRNALNIEDELSLFVLTKLADFYIDLDPTELKIRYNVNPEDQVTNMDIDENINYILNIAFGKSENQDGVDVKGDEYAEHYYQRGRYFIGKNESLRALKQFELAASYDPAHYLAVMEMGEYYIRQGNIEEAWKLLKNAEARYNAFRGTYGNREEDETLKRGDFGRVYFDMGKIIYLGSALVNKNDQIDEFPARKVYPNYARQRSESDDERLKLLGNSLVYFDAALKNNLKDPAKLRELYYYRAWINYMSGDFETALSEFSNLGEEDNYENPNVMLGRANAYYYTDQLNASLGNYLKIKDDFEEKEASIQVPVAEESTHQEIYQTLIAVYNNIGSIYDRKGNSTQALKYYWKSIETARKINTVTEIANFNKEMVFKKAAAYENPLLDDWLSPTVDTIKELQKSKRKSNYL
jgi:hypothetical protein